MPSPTSVPRSHGRTVPYGKPQPWGALSVPAESAKGMGFGKAAGSKKEGVRTGGEGGRELEQLSVREGGWATSSE